MASASSGPKVVGKVDEENGVVSIGVEHDGHYLPVASKSLDGVKALGYDKSGEPASNDDSEGGGK